MKFLIHIWKTTRLAFRQFFEDSALTSAAALAFYAGLSLAPTLVLLVWILGHLGEQWQNRVLEEVVKLVGAEGGNAVRMVLSNAQANPDFGNVLGLIGIGMIVFSGTAVFAQLQNALNSIWRVRAKPSRRLLAFAKKRVLSLGFVFTIACLLVISLLASTGVAYFVRRGAADSTDLDVLRVVLPIVDVVLPLLIYIAFFTAIYSWLPDIDLSWRSVVFGATCTAILFTLGKAGIGLYLGTSTLGSAYGAAGSFVMLLVWVYYSAAIVLFGAEMTKANAILQQRHPRPTAWAEWDRPSPDALPFEDDSREA